MKLPAIMVSLLVVTAAARTEAQDSGAWVELGGSATGGGISDSPTWSYMQSVAMDDQGRPAVAWLENLDVQRYAIHFKRWNGSGWEELAESATKGGVSGVTYSASSPSLAMDRHGNPMIAWAGYSSAGTGIYFRAWNGTAWVEFAGSASGWGVGQAPAGEPPTVPCLAADDAGDPVIAWQQDSNILLRRWDGSAWIELGGSGSGGGISHAPIESRNPALAVSGRRIYVAWEEATLPSTADGLEIYLRAWNGSSWVELGGSASAGGISNTAMGSAFPSLSLMGPRSPVVAWQEGITSTSSDIYLRCWQDDAWVDLGGSASGNGISATPGTLSLRPRMNGGRSERPVVAWQDTSGQVSRVYLRRWNGSSWGELGGSASSPGVGEGVNDYLPCPAQDGHGRLCVAWLNRDIRGTYTTPLEVYLKRWENGGDSLLLAAGESDDTAPEDDAPRCGLLGIEAAAIFAVLRALRRRST